MSYLAVLVICMGVRSLRSVMGNIGMKAILIRMAQLTRGEQVGMWPVLLRANCTMRSSWSGGAQSEAGKGDGYHGYSPGLGYRSYMR